MPYLLLLALPLALYSAPVVRPAITAPVARLAVRSAAPCCTATLDEPAAAAVDESAECKAALLRALEPLDRGFAANKAQQKAVSALLDALVASTPYTPDEFDLDGDWELCWSDAHDIVGLSGGPLARLSRVGQAIDCGAQTIANVIEYTPPSWLHTAAVADDRLQQRVLLSYERDGARVNLKIKGTELRPARVLGMDLSSAPPLTLAGPLSLPFGTFDCLYNDGELRVVKTAQGFWGVNRKLPPDERW